MIFLPENMYACLGIDDIEGNFTGMIFLINSQKLPRFLLILGFPKCFYLNTLSFLH